MMIVLSVVEVLWMYRLGLDSAIQTSGIIGLCLYPAEQERGYVCLSLARSALEIEHPLKIPGSSTVLLEWRDSVWYDALRMVLGNSLYLYQ